MKIRVSIEHDMATQRAADDHSADHQVTLGERNRIPELNNNQILKIFIGALHFTHLRQLYPCPVIRRYG